VVSPLSLPESGGGIGIPDSILYFISHLFSWAR
jgi:hypothetical protein